MTRDEFIDAIWDEMIAGYRARDILAAWLRYLEHQGASAWNKQHNNLTRRPGGWFFSNWMPTPAVPELPHTKVRPVRGRLVPDSDTRAPLAPGGADYLDDLDAGLSSPPVREAADALLRAVAASVNRAMASTGARVHTQTTEDEDIEAVLLALMMMDDD